MGSDHVYMIISVVGSSWRFRIFALGCGKPSRVPESRRPRRAGFSFSQRRSRARRLAAFRMPCSFLYIVFTELLPGTGRLPKTFTARLLPSPDRGDFFPCCARAPGPDPPGGRRGRRARGALSFWGSFHLFEPLASSFQVPPPRAS